MGSEGLELFTDLARARDGIGPLVLAHPGSMARRLFSIARLDELPNLRIEPGAGTRNGASV
jgi:hypothetical protein